MSDLAEAGGGPIIRAIDGQQVEFAELSFYHRRELLRAYRKGRRDELKATHEECGLDKEQRYSELRTFDTETVGESVWAEFLLSDDGRAAILEKSVKLAGKGQEHLLPRLSLDGDGLLELCAAITHTKLTRRGDPNQQGGQGAQGAQAEQNPPKGYGQPD